MNIIITKTSFTGLKPDISEQYMQYQKDELFHRLKQDNCLVSFFPTCSRGEKKKLLRTYVAVIVQESGVWEMGGTARRQKMKEE